MMIIKMLRLPMLTAALIARLAAGETDISIQGIVVEPEPEIEAEHYVEEKDVWLNSLREQGTLTAKKSIEAQLKIANNKTLEDECKLSAVANFIDVDTTSTGSLSVLGLETSNEIVRAFYQMFRGVSSFSIETPSTDILNELHSDWTWDSDNCFNVSVVAVQPHHHHNPQHYLWCVSQQSDDFTECRNCWTTNQLKYINPYHHGGKGGKSFKGGKGKSGKHSPGKHSPGKWGKSFKGGKGKSGKSFKGGKGKSGKSFKGGKGKSGKHSPGKHSPGKHSPGKSGKSGHGEDPWTATPLEIKSCEDVKDAYKNRMEVFMALFAAATIGFVWSYYSLGQVRRQLKEAREEANPVKEAPPIVPTQPTQQIYTSNVIDEKLSTTSSKTDV